ncbi:GAF and ANTAR domain-containing protein [Streptomyces sp. BH-SS-21]|uniref:GAF and ANTAR domain-containing protein n=1 Tax=Streptomyces liliiviolaceus TaxID=2823109 RepID=A0A940Y5J6_9ACTN|nr:GAF and ANTAR domain-containing protein [Streptomyces liliiviolaceus]MBQ0853476.1 GAF and ANTAR domain-containing protein [Streptomyces liliiviolaceus]
MSIEPLDTTRSQELAANLLALVDAPAQGESEEHLLRRLARVTSLVPGVEAAACSLIGPEGTPWRMAATDERTRRLECLQAESRVGPCLDIARGKGPLANIPMSHPHSRTRWPRFTSRALSEGFTAVTALPLVHQDRALGALDLYHQHGGLGPAGIRWARLLADATALGLAHRDVLRDALVRGDQLQNALNSRVLIEQAKGILTERLGCDLQEAFEQLRGHARAKRMKLVDLAALVVADASDTSAFPRRHQAP